VIVDDKGLCLGLRSLRAGQSGCGCAAGQGFRGCGAVTLVTLPAVPDAATMRRFSFEVLGGESVKISLPRWLARAGLQHVGMRSHRHLQSITLSNRNGPDLGHGFVLYTNGPVQMYVWEPTAAEASSSLRESPGLSDRKHARWEPGFGFGNRTLRRADRAVEFRRTAYARRSRCCSFVNVALPTATSPAFESVTWYTLHLPILVHQPPGSVTWQLRAASSVPATRVENAIIRQ